MADQDHPPPPAVTVVGGPSSGAAPKTPPGRPLLRRALGVVAAVAVVAAAVVSQRQAGRPVQECPDPCLTPGSIVVAAALPLTGVLAPFGTAQQRGLEDAVREVNADGGVQVSGERRRVELLVRDTRSEPDVAGQEALILVRGPFRVSGLLGACAPPVALVRVAESRQVPLLTACQPLPELGAPRRHTWEVAPAEAQRAAAVFGALRTAPFRRAGLFLTNDRSEAPWAAAAQEAGFDVVGTYRPQGRSWREAVAQAASDGIEVVVAVTQPPQGIELARELRSQGVDPRSAYVSEAGLGSAWHAAVGRGGAGPLTDLVHPSVQEPATPAQLDEAVTEVSSELTRVLLDGLRRARTAERGDLPAALPGATGEVAGQDVRFRSDQASRLPVRLARWEDGRLVPLPAASR